MLEKALERFLHLNYFNLKQSPDIYSEIKNCINSIRQWTDNYKFCIKIKTFSVVLSIFIRKMGELIAQLISKIEPVKGKKIVEKSRPFRAQNFEMF